MKILWIVNTPIDILGEKLYGKRENGVWMDALLSDFRKSDDTDLLVATTAAVKDTLRFKKDKVTFFALPDSVPILYNENKGSNIDAWHDLLKTEKPDIIQVWGTEFSHGLCALRCAEKLNIPAVIYMQGYLVSIARHYLAGMTAKEIKKSLTLRDLLKQDSLLQQQKRFLLATKKEREEILLAKRIICENDWCENGIKTILPDTEVYRCPLSIGEVFGSFNWDIKNCERHSIICNASGYPLKGLHMLLRAVAILKDKYPDIKLYVPGEPMIKDASFIAKFRKNGYSKYIESLIKKLNVSKNIVWLGKLTQKQLAEQYSKTNVFVMCSAIENHSSSLKEAMTVGMPCVASAVGGIPEYVNHGENGFLYRFEEYDIAASYIEKLFEDDNLALKFSASARESMTELHQSNNVFNRIISIYESICSEGKK